MVENELELLKRELVELLRDSVRTLDEANRHAAQAVERSEQAAEQNKMLIGMHRLLLHQILYELLRLHPDPEEASRMFKQRVITVIENNFDLNSPYVQAMLTKTTEFLSDVGGNFRPPTDDEEWPSFVS